MAIQVDFYGLSLLVWNRTSLRVLLPDARDGMGLPSGRVSVHHPRFLDEKRASTPLELDGHTIELTAASPGRPARGVIKDLIRLNDAKSAPGMKLNNNASVRVGTVTVSGGEIRSAVNAVSKQGKKPYRFGDSNTFEAPACVVRWYVEENVSIRISARDGTVVDSYDIANEAGVTRTLKIGNVDTPNAKLWACAAVPCTPNGQGDMPDEDFAFFYKLFEGTDTSRQHVPIARCDDLRDATMPADRSSKADPVFGATTTTCFPGEWCEDDEC